MNALVARCLFVPGEHWDQCDEALDRFAKHLAPRWSAVDNYRHRRLERVAEQWETGVFVPDFGWPVEDRMDDRSLATARANRRRAMRELCDALDAHEVAR